MLERLDKIIADACVIGRKEAGERIRRGAVRIDGAVCRVPAMKTDPGSACIELGGERVVWRKYCHIMMNKPAGVLSATEDKHEKTALDLLSQQYAKRNLSPAGRLDRDAEGLLLLTDDGALNHAVTAPKSLVKKTYYVRLRDAAQARYTDIMAAGMPVDADFTALPAELVIITQYECMLTVCEGKFHQVKRMFTTLNNEVKYLKRMSIGGLELDNALKTGEYRELTKSEESLIYSAAGL